MKQTNIFLQFLVCKVYTAIVVSTIFSMIFCISGTERGEMTRFLDTKALAERLKSKRGKRGLREISEEMDGIGISTLSRIENGKVPDVENFLIICHWLQASPSEFIKKLDGDTTVDTIDEVEGHLRADRNLDPELAHTLAEFMRTAYVAALEETLNE